MAIQGTTQPPSPNCTAQTTIERLSQENQALKTSFDQLQIAYENLKSSQPLSLKNRFTFQSLEGLSRHVPLELLKNVGVVTTPRKSPYAHVISNFYAANAVAKTIDKYVEFKASGILPLKIEQVKNLYALANELLDDDLTHILAHWTTLINDENADLFSAEQYPPEIVHISQEVLAMRDKRTEDFFDKTSLYVTETKSIELFYETIKTSFTKTTLQAYYDAITNNPKAFESATKDQLQPADFKPENYFTTIMRYARWPSEKSYTGYSSFCAGSTKGIFFVNGFFACIHDLYRSASTQVKKDISNLIIQLKNKNLVYHNSW